MASPEVSVLMPVYNGARFLAEAIDSVLGQTFGDFELLAINDGSSDETAEILARYRDSRVRIVDNGRNLGLIASLNRGFDLARGDFIARMDADDLCFPRRLEKQVNFLRENPWVGLCGTWFCTFGNGKPKIIRPPIQADDMAARLFFESPLGHPTVMFRRPLFVERGLIYKDEFLHAEDYELWTRAAEVTGLANLPDVLLRYRQHEAQTSSLRKTRQEATVANIRLRQLQKIHPDATQAERATHLAILSNMISDEAQIDVTIVESWLLKLIKLNEYAEKGFPIEAFRRAIAIVWWRFCSSQILAPGMLRSFYRSELTRVLSLRNKLGFLAVRMRAGGTPA